MAIVLLLVSHDATDATDKAIPIPKIALDNCGFNLR
jgi:hypothetical protein